MNVHLTSYQYGGHVNFRRAGDINGTSSRALSRWVKTELRKIRNSRNLFSSTLRFFSFSRLFYFLNLWSAGLQPAARHHNIKRPTATFVHYIYTTNITQQIRQLGIPLIVICQRVAREPGVTLCHGLTHGGYWRYHHKQSILAPPSHHTHSAKVMCKILTKHLDLFLPKQC